MSYSHGERAYDGNYHVRKIDREIEHQLGTGHSIHDIFNHEVARLRALDSPHGKLNSAEFKHDLTALDKLLHERGILHSLHITDCHQSNQPECRAEPNHLEHHHRHRRRHHGHYYHHGYDGHGHSDHADNRSGHSHSRRADQGGEPCGKSPDAPLALPTPDFPYPRPQFGIPGLAPGNGWVPLMPSILEGGRRDQIDLPTRPGEFSPDLTNQGVCGDNAGRLRSALDRANQGGPPLSILHFGDSHLETHDEQRAIERGLSPLTLGKADQYETMAARGKTALYPLQHEREWIDGAISRSKPDLVIVSFGSNDANMGISAAAYKRTYDQLVQKIQERAPNAAILLVGPTDTTRRLNPGVDTVIQTQKEVAAQHHLNYLDMREQMGGAGSMAQWMRSGLGAGDGLHFTNKGYDQIGSIVADYIRRNMAAQ